MTAPHSLTDYLATLDAARLRAGALPAHALAEHNDTDRRLYASQLAALLLAGDRVGAGQQRLLSLFLPALDVNTPLPELMALAQRTSQTQLEAFIELVREQQLAACFIVDALVLCRIDQPLNALQGQILSELAALLQVSATDLEQLAQLSALILGIHQGEMLPLNFDMAALKLRCWQSWLRRELTAEMLRSGVSAGWWRISQPLVLDFAFTLQNVDVDFGAQGALQVNCPGDIRVSNCLLHQPRLSFTGSDRYQLVLSHCSLRGNYAHSEQATVLRTELIGVLIEDTHFATRNARALRVASGQVTLQRSQFSDCGHPQLIGGAIASRSDSLQLEHCQFTRCIARAAGGIRAAYLKMTHCQLEQCRSQAWPLEAHDLTDEQQRREYANGAGGILCDEAYDVNFKSCRFTLSSVKFNTAPWKRFSEDPVKHCQFIDSALAIPNGQNLVTNTLFEKATLPCKLELFDDLPPFTGWQNDY